MKNKILVVSVLSIVSVFATGVYAVGQNSGAGTGSQVQQQTQQQLQQQLQDGSGVGNKVQDKNQVQNQGEVLVEERRSQVANAVQEMLQVAERNGGIGQQIKLIAQNQNQNQEKIEVSLQNVQKRSGFAKFFIGANYGEINKAQKMLEQNQEQIQQLNQIRNQLSNKGDQQQLTEQIQTLEQTNLQINNSLETTQKGFSLFGWMFRLFSK